MTEIISKLPHDLKTHIKEYTLSSDIRLKLFYDRNPINHAKLIKMLRVFSSKQLEEINWKYLYYKVYKTSPPERYGDDVNDNLVPFFDIFPTPPTKTGIRNNGSVYEWAPCKLYCEPLHRFKLPYHIIRSDCYFAARTEVGRKRTQYRHIIDAWKAISEGHNTTDISGFPGIDMYIYDMAGFPALDMYIYDMEFELIKAIYVLSNYISKKQKEAKKTTKK